MRQLATVSSVVLLSLSLAGQEWQRLPSSAHPPKDAFVAMAYDAARDRLVCVADEELSEFPLVARVTTWEWDRTRWLQRVTPTTPTGFASNVAAAFDAVRGRVVLVNGGGQTWSFDGVDWQLEPIVGPGNLPVPGPTAPLPSLAFDPVRGVLVLAAFGSQSGHGIYEVMNGAWTFRASLAPALHGTAIGFDPLSARVIGFGGFMTVSPLGVDTTWAWDGTALTVLTPSTVPLGRSEHMLVNDPLTGQLLLVGGARYQNPGPGALADVHAWNGVDWIAQPSLPGPRRTAALAPLGGTLWLFGGSSHVSLGQYSHEMTSRPPSGAWTTLPLLVGGATAAHDSVRARTVALDNGRTLEFDGYRWSDVGIPFPGTTHAGLAFHLATARVVAFDQAGVTWLYDGLAWTQAFTPVAPLPRNGPAMAGDPGRGVVVLMGGYGPLNYLNDVWEWNGIAWTNPQPPSGPPAWPLALGWDGQNVIGVQPGLSTWMTWVWDGVTWTLAATTPGDIAGPRLALDPTFGLILVHTDQAFFETPDRSKRFTGGVWQTIGLPNGIVDARRGGGALVFDTNRGQLVQHDVVHHRDFVFSPQLAKEQLYGTGCSGTASVPRLSAPVLPQLGTTSLADVDRATPSSFVFLLADLAPASVPLPGGCTLLLSNPIVLAGAPTGATGFASMPFPIPPAPALRGIDVFAQALVLDPAGALLAFANLTNGLQLRVGD